MGSYRQCFSDEVVTAALVRIFGRQFGELPLVATKVGMTGKVGLQIFKVDFATVKQP
jgi:hypothetical protein